MNQLRIGIDVGFSAQKRTCGVSANRDVLPSYGGTKRVLLRSDGSHIYCKKLKISEALGWLAEMRAQALLDGAIIIVDGMIGPNGPPVTERDVDHACMTGRFANRAVAASVVGGGQKLAQATAALVIAAAGTGCQAACRFSPQAMVLDRHPLIWETNPTVGLAVTVELVQDVEQLPSRQRSTCVDSERVTAKSDYYWAAGAGQHVAQVLGATEVAGVRDHEHRAALFCLAVALQVAGEAADGSQCLCVGNPNQGTYMLLGPIHASWEQEVRRIGVITA